MRRPLCVLIFVLLLGAGSLVMAGVVGSKHDLTTAGAAFTTTSATDEVCVFCHTPHAGNNLGAALWNRQTPAGPYTMYDSSTIDMTIAGNPQGVSAACLSCHDGTIAFDVLVNATTAGANHNYTPGGTSQGWSFSGADSMAGRGLPSEFGTNLSNQHPISITYNTAQDPAFNPIANVVAAGLVLYGPSRDQVECGSCHNPHDTTHTPFLRISNASSAICTTCHNK